MACHAWDNHQQAIERVIRKVIDAAVMVIVPAHRTQDHHNLVVLQIHSLKDCMVHSSNRLDSHKFDQCLWVLDHSPEVASVLLLAESFLQVVVQNILCLLEDSLHGLDMVMEVALDFHEQTWHPEVEILRVVGRSHLCSTQALALALALVVPHHDFCLDSMVHPYHLDEVCCWILTADHYNICHPKVSSLTLRLLVTVHQSAFPHFSLHCRMRTLADCLRPAHR